MIHEFQHRFPQHHAKTTNILRLTNDTKQNFENQFGTIRPISGLEAEQSLITVTLSHFTFYL